MKLEIIPVKGDGVAFRIANSETIDDIKIPSAEDALRLSIEKWKLIVALRRGDASAHIIDGGYNSCGLCVRYHKGRDCMTCPVREKTGISGCRDTPYMRWIMNPSLKNAEAELAFLEGVQADAAAAPSSSTRSSGRVYVRDTRGRFMRRSPLCA